MAVTASPLLTAAAPLQAELTPPHRAADGGRCFPDSPKGSDCPRNRKNTRLCGQKTYISICLVSPATQLLSEGQKAMAEEFGRGDEVLHRGFELSPAKAILSGSAVAERRFLTSCPAEFPAQRQRKSLPISLP